MSDDVVCETCGHRWLEYHSDGPCGYLTFPYGQVVSTCGCTALTFGVDIDKPMTREERRQESWRRSSRKYRMKKAAEEAQAVFWLIEEGS